MFVWQRNEYFQKQENGDLEIIYDYSTFGCPLEPYPYDDFTPDLRVFVF